MNAWVTWTTIPYDQAEPPRVRVRRQSEYARAALRDCAQRCGAPLDGWQQNADGAPLPNDDWYWSISHKPRMAVAAIARAPVGVDVEAIAPRRIELYDQVARDEEWNIVGGRTWENFFALWTAKESVMKANGCGIGHLSKCRIAARTPDAFLLHFDRCSWRVIHRRVNDHLVGLAGDYGCCEWWESDLHIRDATQ